MMSEPEVLRAREESFLTANFRDFYREVARFRRLVASGDWLAEDGPGQDGPGQEGSAQDGNGREDRARQASTAVWKSLLTTLERQALYAQRSRGDYALKVFAEAQYVMTALADEIFLHLDWGGKEAWNSNILEAKLFRSHRAGEQVFERMEVLLTERNPLHQNLAEVYLMALGLGFEGRFRGAEGGRSRLARYRRRLFDFIYDDEPELVREGALLFPQAYANTLDKGTATRLPNLRPWVLAFFFLALVWVALSIPLWRALVGDLEPIMHDIVTVGIR